MLRPTYAIPPRLKARRAVLGLTISLLWIAAPSAWAEESPVADVTIPKVSPFDDRDYRVLTLENGLQALLVSDPEADKAAASMNVRVGSAQDPDDLQGLAHFLEHMLFLGTEPYPQSDAYQQYISDNAGSHNAFTAQQDTNYFFDIEPSALPGALDRFSEFFLSPLFNADHLESERNIVHSEYMARIRDESRRENDVLNQLLNPDNPTTGFAVGSRDTLADPEGEATLRERVIEFYHRYYDANVMNLAVVAPQPLDELEALVVERFADIPDHDLSAPTIDAPLIDPDTLPRYVERQSLQDRRQLRFYFPIPDPTDEYRTKPTQLIAHLLGDEGDGSLLAVLREAGLADGLSAGVGRGDGNEALFTVSISLTPAGAERLDDIEATLFAAIEQIRADGLAEWRYDEQKSLSEQAFRFQQHGAPQQEATRLAMSLSRYPVEDVQYAAYRMDGMDSERQQRYLDALTQDNMLRFYSAPDVESDTVSPWFNTQWKEQPPTATGQALSGLALPEPNPFIASDLTLQGGQDEQPTALIETPTFTTWHMQDSRFNTPSVEWRVSLQHPSASYSAEEAVLTRLLAGWLNDSLNEPLYPARIAGQSFSAYAHARGMTLSFSGWRDGQTPLIEQAIEQLQQADISTGAFERVRYQLQREWRNAPQASLTGQASRALGEALLTPQWSTAELLEASQRLEKRHLENFRQRFLDDLYIDAMAVGNLNAEQAQEQANLIRGALTPRLTRDDIPPLTPLEVSSESEILHPHSTREESLVLRYLQGRDTSVEEQARLSVLAQWLDTPFYQQLRTEEQLGYIVNAGYSPMLEAPGISLIVQSPDVDSSTIAERMDAFMEAAEARLNTLSNGELAAHRQAVHDRLNQRDTSLPSMANRYWQATALDEVRFDRREQLAALALDVSVEELQSLWPELLSRQLDIRFNPGDSPSDIATYREARTPFDTR
ncbi:MAG: insulinase family protein [Halomonas sp.]|jgi:secreted Zn-dependent insulinase-like peptidase|uniref:insulinase family protein n=1 Tax=Halomonadaceae TaxID=28256 RepID=UPI0005CC53E5|nr:MULTISPECIES: insulinase family protein [Halomonas]KTG22937.1 peptidase M16 [Idiomarina sp. H105]OAE89819.1 peptidase M16 [Idiomarina sp. WRN-38]KJD19081.1 peptidase M16 [Halomonas meridiana]MCC4291833.1 insulinase family protein [Halomonas axialensis]MDK2751662.1 insulinase family protein [Halomonas meridiana]